EFFVKGDPELKYTTTFKVELKKFKDNDRVEKLVGAYTVKNVNGTWQRVSIPLAHFSAIDAYNGELAGWTAVDEFVIILDSRLADVLEGVLYFDNIQFVKHENKLPQASDLRLSKIRKLYKEDCSTIEWAQWIAHRLRGFPQEVIVKKEFPQEDKDFLREIARDTWGFFDNIVDKHSALPLDTIAFTKEAVFAPESAFGDYTNVTNIGLYLACIVAAYDLAFITKEDALERIQQTLNTIERLETHQGFLFNYYDTTTMERTSNFISQIDSGWLTAGIDVVKNAFPDKLKRQCERILSNFDFSFFYDDVAQQFYHGYYTNTKAYANYHYGSFYTEPRIVSYCAIARGDVPMEHWLRLDRTLPESYEWQNQEPVNRTEKTFRGIKYFGGYYEYQDMRYVPSWGGSAFEALMPPLFLKENELAPKSMGLNNKRHAQIQASYPIEKWGYPVWGLSPCSIPGGGYSEYGVNILGLKGYKRGVVTPHATFLALEYIPEQAIANLRKMLELYDIYGEYGFYDAVDPETGDVAYKYLCLDQAMTLIALDNYLNDGAIRNYVHQDPAIKAGEHLYTEENLFE
ncbi:MAG: DUF3131 domain-containing protein, partial [Candidatus Omnitrophica bacterium]|nr:DUF3131 domain-containing protein [Candidatus Omnitrophota bacterium]